MGRRRRSWSLGKPNYVDGRPPELHGLPGAHHVYSAAPNLAALVAASGLTEEEIKTRLRQQGYGPGIIDQLATAELPRVVSSRITAVLGIRHDLARGE